MLAVLWGRLIGGIAGLILAAINLTAMFVGQLCIYFQGLFAIRRKQQCTHPRATEKRWLDRDGTPMIDWRCPDCGERDSGHVYADAKDWVEKGG